MPFFRLVDKLFYRFPDYGKALEAAENIFDLLNRQPTIDNGSKDGEEIVCNSIFDFRNISHTDKLWFSLRLILMVNFILMILILPTPVDLNQPYSEISN